MIKKGFLLVDSLVSVLIVCSLSLLCFSIYKSITKQEEVYANYIEKDNSFYISLYSNLDYCEACTIHESD